MRNVLNIALAGFAAFVILGMGTGSHGDKKMTGVVSSDGGEPVAGILEEGVAGRIITSEGHPVEGAFVQADSPGGSGPPIPDIAILSDGEGRYSWPLLPGAYRLAVTADGYKPAAGHVTVEAGNVAELDFILERLP